MVSYYKIVLHWGIHILDTHLSTNVIAQWQTTVRYKILEGENFGEFDELQGIRQNFLVKNFLL